MSKKNILLITSDQQCWDTIGALNSIIKTPNLDRLFKHGIAADRAYTVNPVCTPTRCSLLTGHYPSRHGCYTIGTNLPKDYPTIPEELNKAGYSTALLGKAHFQSCLAEDSFEAEPAIFNDEYFKNWQGPYYGFQKAKLIIGHTDQNMSRGMHYGHWLNEQGVESDKYFGNNAYEYFGTWELPEKYHPSRWVADETIQTVDETLAEGKPFFIWSSFQDPHNPCVVPEPWASMYDPDEMPLYDLTPGEWKDKPPFYESLMTGKGLDVSMGEKHWYCIGDSVNLKMDESKRRKIMALYYGMISLMDHHIGRILDKLEQENLLDETLIVFTSDHGDYMGNHGIWWKGLPSYDDAQKVPFLARIPGCETPGSINSSLMSVVDLGRTFLEFAEIPIPPGIQGKSQLNSFKNSHVSSREWVQVEFRPSESDFMQKTFVHKDYKAVFYNPDEYGELYNMKNDPHQLHNLWNDNTYAGIKNEMMHKMIQAEMEKDGELLIRTAPA
ncbi:MAG: sulfatase-like hydrolase/transferase [Spirochaetales bacterium]|nr:sulfatase-like hydrolase/transferase [Spirochaetales bacterium]